MHKCVKYLLNKVSLLISLYTRWKIDSAFVVHITDRFVCVSFLPGGVPMRNYAWRRHNHPFTLSFLEEILRCVGMNEVHKAITFFLDTISKQPGYPRIQRWGVQVHANKCCGDHSLLYKKPLENKPICQCTAIKHQRNLLIDSMLYIN